MMDLCSCQTELSQIWAEKEQSLSLHKLYESLSLLFHCNNPTSGHKFRVSINEVFLARYRVGTNPHISSALIVLANAEECRACICAMGCCVNVPIVIIC